MWLRYERHIQTEISLAFLFSTLLLDNISKRKRSRAIFFIQNMIKQVEHILSLCGAM